MGWAYPLLNGSLGELNSLGTKGTTIFHMGLEALLYSISLKQLVKKLYRDVPFHKIPVES